jgi:predicted membrane protein
MTSQEMINDSVAQSIRQEILSMLVCWQRQQETFSNQESGLDSMHPLLSFNATYTGIMVAYGFYHKHQGWVFSFPYIRSVASSILFYVTFYQLHMPSQDHAPLSVANLTLNLLRST